jgi:hypothetical protein
MEEYKLVNRFIERYRTDGRPKVRSRAVSSLMVESLVLKKRENVRWRKEKRTTVRSYRQKDVSYAGTL